MHFGIPANVFPNVNANVESGNAGFGNGSSSVENGNAGFENENSPKGLRNVGCEVCHGPRSKHIKNAMDNTENPKKSEPIAAFKCISCHTPEHSPGFQADEAGYRKKNLHKREQKAK